MDERDERTRVLGISTEEQKLRRGKAGYLVKPWSRSPIGWSRPAGGWILKLLQYTSRHNCGYLQAPATYTHRQSEELLSTHYTYSSGGGSLFSCDTNTLPDTTQLLQCDYKPGRFAVSSVAWQARYRGN